MRVWVTRTEPGATRQAAVLAERGFDVLKAPVLGIEALSAAPPDGRFDVAVFVSEHAVSCAAANGWRRGPVIAIGEAAERALRALGVEPAWPTQASADGVVEVLAPNPPHQALVVKGVGGRTTLKDWLQARGRRVLEWNVYRRVRLEPAIGNQSIDAVVVASGDGLRAVEQLWFAERRDSHVPLLVPSERVAGLAAAMGFERVVVTAGAGAAAVVAALVALNRSGNG